MSATLPAHIATAQACEQSGAWDSAILAYDAALADAPGLAEAHFNRANLLLRRGRAAEALAGYDRAIKLHPRWADAHLNRGALLAGQNRLAAAIDSYRMATRCAPQNDRAWNNLGNTLCALGRYQEAIEALRTALRCAPGSAIARFNLGNALTGAGQLQQAVEAYMAALMADPGFAAAAINLSARLRQFGATEAALNAADLAVNTAPGLAQAHSARGGALYDLGQFAEAEASYRQALSAHAGCPLTLANLGLVLAAQHRFEEALDAYDAALGHAPGYPQAAFGRATTLLACGDFARGWPAFAARAEMPEATARGFRQPVWQGEAAPGLVLLVHAEQGLGDTLQFVRFVPPAAARSGARVLLEVQPPLVRLLQGLPGVARVIPRGAKLPRFDLHVPMLDLPGIFAPSLEALAPAAPYLSAEPGLIAARRLPAQAGALQVGLVWAGQSRPDQPHAFAMDRRRSLPLAAFAPLAPLCRDGVVKLFSLQHGPAAAQLATAPEGLDIADAMTGVADFADTAAIVAQLDLVIAVDTSTAHLAAAMGRPTWLLTRADACWRWLHGRDDSPWYPSLTLFRQSMPGDWRTVIGHVVDRLHARKVVLF